MKKIFTIISVLILLGIAGYLVFNCKCKDKKDSVAVEARDDKPWEILAKQSDLQKRIAMFLIPLNATTDGTFTDFELKASTNNFASTSIDSIRLQFYAQSEIAAYGLSAENNNGIGIDRMWMFQPTTSGDGREWLIQSSTMYWPGKPMTIAVFVDTSCLVRHPQDSNHPENDWLINTNKQLTWIWHRVQQNNGSTVHELVSGTSTFLWRPIAPAAWLDELPDWATYQINNSVE